MSLEGEPVIILFLSGRPALSPTARAGALSSLAALRFSTNEKRHRWVARRTVATEPQDVREVGPFSCLYVPALRGKKTLWGCFLQPGRGSHTTFTGYDVN